MLKPKPRWVMYLGDGWGKEIKATHRLLQSALRRLQSDQAASAAPSPVAAFGLADSSFALLSSPKSLQYPVMLIRLYIGRKRMQMMLEVYLRL